MPLFTDFVDPAELTQAARLIPDPTYLTLNEYLPDETIQDVEAKIVAAEIQYFEAQYRAWDTPTPIGKRTASMSVKRVTLPPLGQKLPVGEWERIRLETIKSNTNGPFVEQAYKDTASNVFAVRMAAERARARLLTTGVAQVPILTASGLQTPVVDFGVAAGNLNVAPATLWSDPTADAWGDFQAWWEAYATGTLTGFNPVPNPDGQYPGKILTSRRVLNALRNNLSFVRALLGANAVVSSGLSSGATISARLTRAQINEAMTAEGYPEFEVYETKFNGTRLIPDNLVILMPTDPNQLGRTTWGLTAEALELVGSNAVDFTIEDAPGITACQLKEDDPVTVWTKANATMLPVLKRPDLLFTAAVLTSDGL